MAVKEVMRADVLEFLEIGGKYEIIGEGVESLGINYNADSSEKGYIHQKFKNNTTNSITKDFDLTIEGKAGDPVFDFVDDLRVNLKINNDAKVNHLEVNLYKEVSSGKYRAVMTPMTIAPTSRGDAAVESAKFVYKFSQAGEQVVGTVTMSGLVPTFTPNSAPTPSNK